MFLRAGAFMLFLCLAKNNVIGQCANLTPYQPAGWDNKIVLSTVTGTNTSASTFSDNQTIYLDWAVLNNGTCNVSLAFYTKIYLDGVLKATYNTLSLAANTGYTVYDLSFAPMAAASHTFQVVVDAFKKFRIENGNLVWGKDWDMIFPLYDLYPGRVK
jgi:hypothetical protein